MKKTISLLIAITTLMLASCSTVMKVSEKKENGYFNASKEAEILVNKPFDLDNNKSLLVVPTSTFMKGMAEKVGYFDRVITFEDLEIEIIRDNKQDEIGELSCKIGINKINIK